MIFAERVIIFDESGTFFGDSVITFIVYVIIFGESDNDS